MRILIIRFSSLGDITMATAMPRVLRKKFPDAEIDFATAEEFKDVIEWNPYLDKKMYLSRGGGIGELFRVLREIKSNKYDVIIDAHRSIRSTIICMLTPSVKKLYLNKRTLQRLLLIYLKLNVFKRIELQIVEYIKPLKRLGVFYDGKGTEIFIPADVKERVKKAMLVKIKNFGQKKLVGFVPSAHWPGKRWSVDNFKDLAGLITKELGADIIIVGGKKDTFCADIARSYDNVHSFAGEFGIAESAAALSMCELVVANDTGMMHVAEAVEVDVVSIMGPTSYEFGCYPHRPKSRVVEIDMWCRPCSKNGQGVCIRSGKRPCLNDVTPEMVLDKVMDSCRRG
ncbi:MAG: glycosyltransferase family 9 protein [Pseudomonadota bacterium]